MEECPVCLESLTGTVVHLGCCKKQLHIQCYVNKCPMCRAELPSPPSLSVVVPVPVAVPVQTRQSKFQAWCLFITSLSIVAVVLLSPQIS